MVRPRERRVPPTPASPEGHAVGVVAITAAVYLGLAGQVLAAVVVVVTLVIIVFLKGTPPDGDREWKEFQARRDQRPGTPSHKPQRRAPAGYTRDGGR